MKGCYINPAVEAYCESTTDSADLQLIVAKRARTEVERSKIDALSDDDIIDAYITCSCCGAKQVNEQRLEAAIEMASDADSLFQICDTHFQICDAQAIIKMNDLLHCKPSFFRFRVTPSGVING